MKSMSVKNFCGSLSWLSTYFTCRKVASVSTRFSHNLTWLEFQDNLVHFLIHIAECIKINALVSSYLLTWNIHGEIWLQILNVIKYEIRVQNFKNNQDTLENKMGTANNYAKTIELGIFFSI